jgi:hypothetical protein
VGAIWRQVLKDAQSARLTIRQPALDFLADGEALHFWEEMLGVSVEVLARYAQHVLRTE